MVGIAWCSKGNGRRSGEGQRCQKVVPGGEDQEGGDGSQIFEEPAARAHLLHRPAPEIFGQIADGMEGESEKVQGHEHGGKIDFPVPEVVFEMVSVVLRTLKLSFSIFQRARPQAASSATVSGPTSRSVMKLLRYVTAPAALTISIISQLTVMASASPRSGTSVSQR